MSRKKLVCLFCFKEAEDGRHNVDARGRLNVFKRVFFDRAERRRRRECSKTFASASFLDVQMDVPVLVVSSYPRDHSEDLKLGTFAETQCATTNTYHAGWQCFSPPHSFDLLRPSYIIRSHSASALIWLSWFCACRTLFLDNV